jgi:hypothetical protein
MRLVKYVVATIVLFVATNIGFSQSTVTLAVTCGSTTTTSTLLTTTQDPCRSTPGNVSIDACHSCGAQANNGNSGQVEVRLTPPNQAPGGSTDISVGVPGGGSYTINPISAGVPDGSYDIYVTNPCTGLLVKCGTLKVRNC